MYAQSPHFYPSRKPFCIFLSRRLFSFKKLLILEEYTTDNILYQTGWRVIGLKFAGSLVSPFLYINIVAPTFQHSGNRCTAQHSFIILWSKVRNMGQCLSIKIDNWSRGQVDELDLQVFIALATYAYVGLFVTSALIT